MTAALKRAPKAKVLAQAKRAVADRMFDPESTRIRDIKLQPFEDGYVICGQVNAKNRYGAYTGYKTFVASTSEVSVRDGTEDMYDDLALIMVLYSCNVPN